MKIFALQNNGKALSDSECWKVEFLFRAHAKESWQISDEDLDITVISAERFDKIANLLIEFTDGDYIATIDLSKKKKPRQSIYVAYSTALIDFLKKHIDASTAEAVKLFDASCV
jgi:hypothetical protein